MSLAKKAGSHPSPTYTRGMQPRPTSHHVMICLSRRTCSRLNLAKREIARVTAVRHENRRILYSPSDISWRHIAKDEGGNTTLVSIPAPGLGLGCLSELRSPLGESPPSPAHVRCALATRRTGVVAWLCRTSLVLRGLRAVPSLNTSSR